MLTNSPTVAARRMPPLLGCAWAGVLAAAGLLIGAAPAAAAGALVGAAPAAAGAVVGAAPPAAGLVAGAPVAAGALVGAGLGGVGAQAVASGRLAATATRPIRNVRRLTAVGTDR